MVRISSQRVKGGTAQYRLKKHPHGSKFDKEKLSAFGLACFGLGYVLWSLVASRGDHATSASSLKSSAKAKSLEEMRIESLKHPQLDLANVEPTLAEYYNAIAADIITTLNCADVLNMTKELERQDALFGGEDGEGGADMDDKFVRGGGGGAGGANKGKDKDKNKNNAKNNNKGNDDDPAQDSANANVADTQRHRRLQRRERLREVNADTKVDLGEDPADTASDKEDKDMDTNRNRPDDDPVMGENGDFSDYVIPTAEHLFCLAAFSPKNIAGQERTAPWKDKVHCDATNTKQKLLLDLWTAVRSEIEDNAVLRKILNLSTEVERRLAGTYLHLWSPTRDNGIDYMLSVINDEEKTVDHGGIYGLSQNLGKSPDSKKHPLFVDVGSYLGITSMAIALLYPGTHILSIEAAPPNWLLQEMNWICNADKFKDLRKDVILSGVGPTRAAPTFQKTQPQMAKFLWRPQATTSTRSWTPHDEYKKDTDLEITVKLRPWHSILAEADIPPKTPIDVLNVDCEGCEYNLIPALSEREYQNIKTVMGSIHWGYIPLHKLPSSERGKKTHELLCQHENFARAAKECCQFPDMPVISSTPNEVLYPGGPDKFPPKAATVADVAGSLCDDFDDWAVKHHLNDVQSDFGWFQLTSTAD